MSRDKRPVCRCSRYAFPHHEERACVEQQQIDHYESDEYRRDMQASWNADRAASIRSIGGTVR